MDNTKTQLSLTAAKEAFDFWTAKCLGKGGIGLVFELGEEYVFKMFDDENEWGLEGLNRERAIFEEIQSQGYSKHIVRFFEAWEDGLILERLNTTVRNLFRDPEQKIDMETRRRWIVEAYRGLELLHQKGIMHGDIGCHNYLVDNNHHIKLCDFESSMRRGEKRRIFYEFRGLHPESLVGGATVKSEIFALGSVVFEIYTTKPPYSAESELTVREKYRNGDFPLSDLKCPYVREIVRKCWEGEYVQLSEMNTDLERIRAVDFSVEAS